MGSKVIYTWIIRASSISYPNGAQYEVEAMVGVNEKL